MAMVAMPIDFRKLIFFLLPLLLFGAVLLCFDVPSILWSAKWTEREKKNVYIWETRMSIEHLVSVRGWEFAENVRPKADNEHSHSIHHQTKWRWRWRWKWCMNFSIDSLSSSSSVAVDGSQLTYMWKCALYVCSIDCRAVILIVVV